MHLKQYVQFHSNTCKLNLLNYWIELIYNEQINSAFLLATKSDFVDIHVTVENVGMNNSHNNAISADPVCSLRCFTVNILRNAYIDSRNQRVSSRVCKISCNFATWKTYCHCLSEYNAVRSPKVGNSWDMINPKRSKSTLNITVHLWVVPHLYQSLGLLQQYTYFGSHSGGW